MAKIPNTVLFSSKHLLVLSLALNVSLILRMLYEGEQGHNNNNNNSCFKNETGTSIARADLVTKTHSNILKSRVVMATSTSSLANSTCTDVIARSNRIINLDHGNPTVYERFWRQSGDKTSIIIQGWQSMSYFSDVSNICWFLVPEFAKEVMRLHRLVGNAVTEGRYIVVGTGSSQLFLAALYALSPSQANEPTNVVCASPYYSSYPTMTDYLKSGLYKWGGDANSYEKDGPYIELITTPNNPDGHVRTSKVNRSLGLLVHDLAYYWPQYTPISFPADNDLTLFTLSKITGHAGSRIGWALVKDKEVAKKMTKFIELNSIGVSKDSQLRAAKVLSAVSDSCEQENSQEGDSFFEFSHKLMTKRWKQLREVVNRGELFSLPQFSPAFCNFFNQVLEPQPAFVWLKCEGNVEDCESFLRGHKILTRSGKQFGVSTKYVRISLLDTDESFSQFLDRLSSIKSM